MQHYLIKSRILFFNFGIFCCALSACKTLDQENILSNQDVARSNTSSSCPSLGEASAPSAPDGRDRLAISGETFNLVLDLSHRPSVPYQLKPGADSILIQFADELTIEVLTRGDTEGYGHHEIANALAYIPWKLRKNVHRINLRIEIPSQGNAKAAAYSPYGQNGTIFLFKKSWGLDVGRLAGILAHEAAHCLINETYAAGAEPWISYEKIIGAEPYWASTYAKKGGKFEDFAETLELYLDVIGTPQEKRYRIFLPMRFSFFDMIRPDERWAQDPCSGGMT